MIARLWRGRTAADDANDYLRYMLETGIQGCSAADGNRGVLVLRRHDGREAEFLVLSLWDSLDSVRTFAGPDPENPVYYARDGRYLLELEPQVAHYEVDLPLQAETTSEPLEEGPAKSEETGKPIAKSWMEYLVTFR